MNQNGFGGAVIPAMAGFLFWKRAKVEEIQQEPVKNLPALVNTGSDGLTSVAKYITALPLVTGVNKYLKKQEKHQISSVEKYLLKQTIAQRNAPAPTSVAKYLAHAEKTATKRLSSVDKYLVGMELEAKQQTASLTGVAKYQAEQNLIERKKAAAAMVQRYREEEERAAIAAKEAAQAAYENTAQQENEQEEALHVTGLGRYLQNQAKLAKNKAKPTGVARYIAKQIIIDSQKPALSSVSKYLRDQQLSTHKKPPLTGVAKYLSRLDAAPAKPKKPQLPPSGVAKYISSQEGIESTKPSLSGVAKYLNKLDKAKPHLALVHHKEEDDSIEKCLEGEFIPAERKGLPLTGVARYLEKQTDSGQEPVKMQPTQSTGVARYIEKHSDISKADSSIQPLTGVDRYLQRRA